ncbi:hypothetical protein B0H13DRAFT_1890937 [Mycena leptocephala]|nr:hypothetical protein B0H13DRAFT_1890937 [Mycena leptocephala]
MIEASYHYSQLPSTALQSVDALSKRFFREGKLITAVSFEQARGLALVQIYFNNNYNKDANAQRGLHIYRHMIASLELGLGAVWKRRLVNRVDSHTDAQKFVVYVAVRDKGEVIRDPQTNKYQNDVSTRVRGWKAAAKVNPTPAIRELRKDVIGRLTAPQKRRVWVPSPPRSQSPA